MTNAIADFAPWIVGFLVLLALFGAASKRHSRRRRKYPRRRRARTGTSRPQRREFPREPLPGRIRRVVDGDSIEADVTGFGRLQIRLANVDAPEHDQPWGREASDALSRLVQGGKPKFRLLYRDQYARVITLISVKGAVVNELLVRDGHAWAYDQYLPGWQRAKYKGLERSAQDTRAGLWGATTKPVPPWKWRR